MKNILLTALIAIVASLITWQVLPSKSGEVASKKETTYERVMRTGTLRCGYVDYEPNNMRDPETNKMSGIFYDIMESVAAKLDWKIEWVVSAGWGTHIPDLVNNKYDVFCGASWNFPEEAKHTLTVGPLYYSVVSAWTRVDDNRFDNGLEGLNSPKYTVAAVDMTIADDVRRDMFPNTKAVTHPQSTDYSVNLLDVITNKADITFVENFLGYRYMVNNPNKVKNVSVGNPISVYGNFIVLRKEDLALQTTIEGTIFNMMLNGEVDEILAKYASHPSSFLAVPKPYMQP